MVSEGLDGRAVHLARAQVGTDGQEEVGVRRRVRRQGDPLAVQRTGRSTAAPPRFTLTSSWLRVLRMPICG